MKEMKKLFISCPMRGRTNRQIRKSLDMMHLIAETYMGEELERIPSYIEDEPPKTAKQAAWCLGKSIQMMAEADVVICVDKNWMFRGCEIERLVAINYEIPLIEADIRYVAPDILEEGKKK